LVAFVLRDDQRPASVELAYDLENDLFALMGRRMCQEQPADPQVGFGARVLRN
jgi:hypothetical protein